MSRSLRYSLCVCVLWAGQSLVGSRAAGQELDPRLKKILADWKKRQERVKTVRYRVEGESIAYKEGLALLARSFKTKPPTKDVRTRPSFTLLLDFTTNRHRLETQGYSFSGTTNELTKITKTIAYDGKQIVGVGPWTGESVTKQKPKTKETDAAIGTGTGVLQHAPFEPTQWPCFAAHGLVVISDSDQIIPGRLKFEPDMSLLGVHGQAVHNGRPCLVLRTPARKGGATTVEELWLETGRDGALARRRHLIDRIPRTDAAMQNPKT